MKKSESRLGGSRSSQVLELESRLQAATEENNNMFEAISLLQRKIGNLDTDNARQGCSYFAITSKILKISTEHKEPKCSSESKLHIHYTCSIGILVILDLIAKIAK